MYTYFPRQMHFCLKFLHATQSLKDFNFVVTKMEKRIVEHFWQYFYCLFQATLIRYLFLNGFYVEMEWWQKEVCIRQQIKLLVVCTTYVMA